MIYVASPYTSPNPATVTYRYQRVCEFIDRMVVQGQTPFSPIAYCHPIAQRIGGGTDAQTWLRFNMSMLRRAEFMYLLQLPDWENSQGIKIELNVCEMLAIPVAHYSADFTLLTEAWHGWLIEQY